jgi:hypothetical protein
MKIASVMPADGWFAEFHDRHEVADGLVLVTRVVPLVGWAVVGDRGARNVVGLVSREPGEGRGPDWIAPVEESVESFAGYTKRDRGQMRLNFPDEGSPDPPSTHGLTGARWPGASE